MSNTNANEDGNKQDELHTFIENKYKISYDGLGSKWKFWRRRRCIVIMMVFLGEFTKGLLRSNFSVAVFSMTDNHTYTDGNRTESHVGEFDWSAKTRGYLLSAFFYGYVATNIPGGILAVKFGGGKLFGFGILFTSISTLFTPLVAPIHLYLLIALRICEGMCEGVVNPSAELLLASWVPSEERSSSLAVVVTGSAWGHVISLAVCSAIGYHCGWEAIFYFTGGVGVMWFVAWFILVKDHPKVDNRISSSELAFIQKCRGSVRKPTSKLSSIPFVKISTSLPVWAIISTNIALSWSNVTYITQVPAYIKDVLKLSYHTSGYVSSLSFGSSVLVAYLTSPMADIFISRNKLSVTAARKIYICGSLAAMGILSFLIQLVTSATYVIVCLTGMQIFTTVCVVPAVANVLDIAPKYSSVLSGFVTTIFSICGTITPTLIGYLTQSKTAEEWHIVFSIQCGICFVVAAVYGALGSGQLQPWALPRNRPMSEDDVHSSPS